jgi:hypothetical protein
MQTIQVVLHDNKTFTLGVEGYDPVALAAELNNTTLTVVTIGSLIINRNAVKIVLPVSAPTE